MLVSLFGGHYLQLNAAAGMLGAVSPRLRQTDSIPEDVCTAGGGEGIFKRLLEHVHDVCNVHTERFCSAMAHARPLQMTIQQAACSPQCQASITETSRVHWLKVTFSKSLRNSRHNVVLSSSGHQREADKPTWGTSKEYVPHEGLPTQVMPCR